MNETSPGRSAIFPDDRVVRLTIHAPGGRVERSNLTHPANRDGPYTFEDVIELTPIPEPGYQFVEWHGPVVRSGTPPRWQVVMYHDLYLRAVFARTAVHPLTVSPINSGVILVHPPDNSGRPRNGQTPDVYPRTEWLPEGTVVRLTAIPTGDHAFDRWLGPGITDQIRFTNPLELVITGSRYVQARFAPSPVLSATLRNKPIKKYFQGHRVMGAIRLMRNGARETLSTTPRPGQTAGQAFDAVRDFIIDRVDMVQSLQIMRYDPVQGTYRRENVNPPAPVLNLDYVPISNTARDGPIAAQIQTSIADAKTEEERRRLENCFLHGRWRDPTDPLNRLLFLKSGNLPYLTHPGSDFKVFLAAEINRRLGLYPVSGLFMDDTWIGPPLPTFARSDVHHQPCFNADRADVHAACTFDDLPGGRTRLTLRKVPGPMIAAPVVRRSGGEYLIASSYLCTADTPAQPDSPQTCTADLDVPIDDPDATVSYAFRDPIVFDRPTADAWPSHIMETLSYLRSQVSTSKLIVYNPRSRAAVSRYYAQAVSGTEDEYFIHSFYVSRETRISPQSWKETIDDLAEVSAHRIYIAQSGTSEDLVHQASGDQETEIRRLAMFVFCSYLLGKGPCAFFNFDTPMNGLAGSNYHAFDFYDLDIGSAVGGYSLLGSSLPVLPADPWVPAIYQRRFERALVLVNPAIDGPALPYAIANADGDYNVLVGEDGTFRACPAGMVTGTLAPQSAVILARQSSRLDFPVILSQSPPIQTVREGASGKLSVNATGKEPLWYSWRRNGTIIPGVWGPTLIVPAADLSDQAEYVATVHNDDGVAVSSPMRLTVVPVPRVIIPPASRAVRPGGSAYFHIVAAGPGPLTYRWRKNGSPLVDGEPFQGANTDMLSITPVSSAEAGYYDCQVTSIHQESVTSPAAALVVDPSAVNMSSARTRRVHGDAGSFDIELPTWPSGTCVIEPRMGVTLVLTFDRELTPQEQAMIRVNGEATCGNGLECTGNTVSMELPGQGCGSYAVAGINLDPWFLEVGIRPGDANRDGLINTQDMIMVRRWLNRPLHEFNFTCDSNGDGRIDPLDLQNVSSRMQSPNLISAVSRKVHGSAGEFDIDLLAPGATEPRSGGPTWIETVFDRPIQLVHGVASVAVSSGTVDDLIPLDHRLGILLHGAAARQPFTISFPGVASRDSGTAISSSTLCFVIQPGDVNQDRHTNLLDLVLIRNMLNGQVNGWNYRMDLNADGLINVLDLVVCRNPISTSSRWCP